MLSRLTLIVTHRCNLHCSYCYAEGGDYGLPCEKMLPEKANDIVNHFANQFGGFKEILFFGGEPLLAFDTIKAACDQSLALVSRGVLSERPAFIIVTNGTLIDQRFVAFAQDYKLNITVSLDGPPDIHDAHRRTTSGNKTFQKVVNGINLLAAARLPFSLECTYTVQHWESGYSPLDIYKYLRGLGASQVIFAEEMAPGCYSCIRNQPFADDYFNATIDMLEYLSDELLTNRDIGFSEFSFALNAIIHRPELLKDYFCGAGRNTFTVNPMGQTYPCHILNGHPDYCLGFYKNIVEESAIIPKKNEIQSCSSCSIRNFCRACPARMLIASDFKEINPSPVDCDYKKAFVGVALKTIDKLLCEAK